MARARSKPRTRRGTKKVRPTIKQATAHVKRSVTLIEGHVGAAIAELTRGPVGITSAAFELGKAQEMLGAIDARFKLKAQKGQAAMLKSPTQQGELVDVVGEG